MVSCEGQLWQFLRCVVKYTRAHISFLILMSKIGMLHMILLPSLFVCSDGVLELKNTSHLAFVHFEGLLNVHKSPIFNEILTKIPDTRFLFEIPSSI